MCCPPDHAPDRCTLKRHAHRSDVARSRGTVRRTLHDYRDALTAGQGPIVRHGAQYVGAGLVELHTSRDFSISRHRRREPGRRPARVRARRARRARNSSRLLALGMPSAAMVATSVTHSPTLACRGPSVWMVGGLLARTVGLLVPGPSAPVSEASPCSP